MHVYPTESDRTEATAESCIYIGNIESGVKICRPHLPRANFSCHLPLAIGAGAELDSGTSSIVSCMVATAFNPVSGISVVGGRVVVGFSSINAFDVFFCRSPQDCEPLLSIAELVDDSRVRL